MTKRLAVALLLCVLAAFPLAACGSSQGGSSAPEAEAESPPAKTPKPPVSGKANTPSQKANSKPSSHNEGAEESVERYGSEAEGSGKEAILGAEHAYLSAVAEKDFSTACSYLAASVTSSLKQFASPQLKSKGCPGLLAKFLSPTAPGIARQQAEGEIKKVRIKGDQAFVIFHAPGARLWVLTMQRQGGGWKATTIAGSILAPSAATLGNG